MNVSALTPKPRFFRGEVSKTPIIMLNADVLNEGESRRKSGKQEAKKGRKRNEKMVLSEVKDPLVDKRAQKISDSRRRAISESTCLLLSGLITHCPMEGLPTFPTHCWISLSCCQLSSLNEWLLLLDASFAFDFSGCTVERI